MKYRAGMVILAGTVFGTSSLAAMPTDEPELPASIAAWGKTEGKPCVLDNGLPLCRSLHLAVLSELNSLFELIDEGHIYLNEKGACKKLLNVVPMTCKGDVLIFIVAAHISDGIRRGHMTCRGCRS